MITSAERLSYFGRSHGTKHDIDNSFLLLLRLLARINLVPHRAVDLQQEPRDVLRIVNQNLFISEVWSEVF